MPMTQQQALEAILPQRGNRVVITTMSSAGIWPRLSDSPLDFAYIPSAMGHAPGLGLGLALAQPGRGVIVINGDGCMLMNLGSLVTLASQPALVYLLILDNGIYEVTGGQVHPGAGHADFALLARGAGIKRVYTFETLEKWRSRGGGSSLRPRAGRHLAQSRRPPRTENPQAPQANARTNRTVAAGSKS